MGGDEVKFLVKTLKDACTNVGAAPPSTCKTRGSHDPSPLLPAPEILPDGLPIGFVSSTIWPGGCPISAPRAGPGPPTMRCRHPGGLVALLTARSSVPHKIRNRLTQSAQYIETSAPENPGRP